MTLVFLVSVSLLIISVVGSRAVRRRELRDKQRILLAREKELADRIDRWHANPAQDQPLHEYLGLTLEQYERWLKDPDALYKGEL